MSCTRFVGLMAGMLWGCGAAVDVYAAGNDVIDATPKSSPATLAALERAEKRPSTTWSQTRQSMTSPAGASAGT